MKSKKEDAVNERIIRYRIRMYMDYLGEAGTAQSV
jgi:hypothetical protein